MNVVALRDHRAGKLSKTGRGEDDGKHTRLPKIGRNGYRER